VGDVTRRGNRGLRIGLQRLPAYILQGGTNLSPQVSLDWPGSESSTVQSREDGEGGGGRGEQGGGGRVGKHCINALTPSTFHMYSNTGRHSSTLALHATDYESWQHRTQEGRSNQAVSGAIASLPPAAAQDLRGTGESCWKAKATLKAGLHLKPVQRINYT